MKTLLAIIAVLLLAIVILLFTRLPPGPPKPKSAEKGQADCVIHLKMIDSATDQWSVEQNKRDGDMPLPFELAGLIPGGIPACPSGGNYTIRGVGRPPVCSIAGHTLK